MFKPVWAFILSTFFAIAITVTPVPERFRIPVVVFAWSVCLIAALGWGFSHLRDKRLTIANIPVECGPNVKGSVVKANGFTFYRARIEPKGNEQFPDLIARLHSVKRDGVEMPLDEVLQIKYHPGDGSAPCARKDDPAFLDVVFVSPETVADLHVLFWPPGMTQWNFESGHTYLLDIAVLSNEISRRCEFEFVWTGDTNTSFCRLISDGTNQPVAKPSRHPAFTNSR